jgi:tetratricopeptide (TPR) repeat protein
MANKRKDNAPGRAGTLPNEPGLADETTDEESQPPAKSIPAPRPQARTASGKPAAVNASSKETLTRNVVCCVVGLALGFLLGFLLANKLIAAPRPQGLSARAAQAPDGAAPPLDPTQTTGELPPGHPDIGSGPQSGAGAAATSADAQQAMAAADDKPKDFDLQMNAAATFYKAGDYAKAELYLQRALAVHPKDVDALTAMGNTKYDKGDFVGAADYYQRVLAIQPQNADVQTDLGNAFFRRTPPDYARAVAEYRKTLAIDPKHENALKNMATAALYLKDKETARKAIDQLAAVNPDNPTIAALRDNLNSLP